MLAQYQFTLTTPGRGMVDITNQTKDYVNQTSCNIGLCHIFLHHTSASVVLCENADTQVQADMEAFMKRLVPDGDSIFEHIAEGPDDMPSHVRTMITSSFLSIPIREHQLVLGTWQGIYLWEHRTRPHKRTLTFTIMGE